MDDAEVAYLAEIFKTGVVLNDDVTEAAKVYGPRHRIIVEALAKMMESHGTRDATDAYRAAYAMSLAEAKTNPVELAQLGAQILAICHVDDDPVATVCNAFAVAAGLVGQAFNPAADPEGHNLVGLLAGYTTAVGMSAPNLKPVS